MIDMPSTISVVVPGHPLGPQRLDVVPELGRRATNKIECGSRLQFPVKDVTNSAAKVSLDPEHGVIRKPLLPPLLVGGYIGPVLSPVRYVILALLILTGCGVPAPSGSHLLQVGPVVLSPGCGECLLVGISVGFVQCVRAELAFRVPSVWKPGVHRKFVKNLSILASGAYLRSDHRVMLTTTKV